MEPLHILDIIMYFILLYMMIKIIAFIQPVAKDIEIPVLVVFTVVYFATFAIGPDLNWVDIIYVRFIL